MRSRRGIVLLAVLLVTCLFLPPRAGAQGSSTPGSSSPGTSEGGTSGEGAATTPSSEAPSSPPPTTATPAPGPPSPLISSGPRNPFLLLGEPGLIPAATFDLRYSLALAEEYSSNFNLTSKQQQENFRTSLSPGATLLINGALTKGLIGYTLTAAHDSSGSSDNVSLFHSLIGQVTWQPTPLLSVIVSDVFSRSDSPDQADSLSLRRERRVFDSNTFTASANYLIARVNTRASYSNSIFFGEQGGADTISHTVSGGASTRLGETNTLSVDYSYLTSETTGDTSRSGGSNTSGHQIGTSLRRQLSVFTDVGVASSFAWRTSTNASGTETDYTIGTVSLFSSYSLGNLSAIASIGVTRLDSDVSSGNTGLTTSSSLSYRFAKAVATVGVEKGFSETFAQGENFGVVETFGVTGGLTYPVTPFISASATGFYRENTFTGVGGGRSSGTQETWGTAATTSVPLLRWLTLALSYGYSESQGAGSEFREHHARVSLTAGF